ncbi:UDP-N-acetylglucosamine--N-acetylmuramyl-(pentapeptide) pyrophosphoryl-undecaprenol N-acetylglucosamine transferase [Patescibacteria group bacterium]|nr:UDP-N-acetylglucosamine--N-acetylmuramyl-(pentapeptide) pyrophosphoryl-undecaprenol N-acetylglucosamine transferase [Patescibacteria group bacterium]MBU0776966.1 UDP-N-acetylglucosamine--N-acetylmuramyl-(pentapeptide) pyrophosphoryl-undecaprenol N-acetylglucosamine transferase [Patescibacteria group bacterium]MBU0845684.1 UDP-N-acetylglucosamine--N-acetylmuramyl-(pentapeptide) pyrophosphoryl-undecaprenol N-acetylglucosamine transferase [Patescibacteria group bacterium]MBU0922995.1 UDP-N-acety
MRINKKQDKEKDKIVLTGGHAATTALATVEELIRRESWDIYWIGAKTAIEGKNIPTLESKILPKIGIRSHKIISGRIQRKLTFWTLPSLIKIPIGFIHATFLLLKIRPKIILSFGGAASFPVVVIGFCLRIPIVIHEQTSAAGRANKSSARFAKEIALAREGSKKHFPCKKCKVVGNPLLTQIAEIEPKNKIGNPPTVFVTGGSRGSQTINTFVLNVLEKLLKNYLVVHQTGFLDYEKIKKLRDSLPNDLKERYEIYSVLDPMDIDGVYRRADIVVARAGANTVSEIVATKRPSVLIPIPWSYENEQVKNAEFAEKFGLAKVLNQETLSGNVLYDAIKDVEGNWEDIVKNVRKKKSLDINASKKLVNILEGLV